MSIGKSSSIRMFVMLRAAVTAMLITVIAGLPAYGQSDKEPLVLIVLLDVSGSMLEGAGDGRTKIEVAREALKDLLADVGVDAQVGLRVYGSKLPSGADGSDERRRNCQRDTEQLIPVGDLDRSSMQDVVDDLDALGDTPIALGLESAASDIPEGTLGTIVLISDGRDECFPFGFGDDPSETAGRLFSEGIRVRKIETVGFQVSDDPQAVQELKDIAEAGNGSFTPVEDATKLAERLRPIVLGSFRTAERLGGEPVEGGLDVDDAPVLELGRYTDTLEPGTPKYYRASIENDVNQALTATVFEVPARKGTSVQLDTYVPDFDGGSLDLTSPLATVVREDAGLDRTGADSVRSQQRWSWIGGSEAVEVIYRLTLDAKRSLSGDYYVEIDHELPQLDDGSAGCPSGSRCDFERRVADKQAEVDRLRASVDAVAGSDVEDLRQEAVELASAVSDAEARVGAIRTHARITAGLTAVLVLAALGGAILVVRGRQRRSADR